MIKVLHSVCKAGMIVWTLGCCGFWVLMLVGMMTKQGAETAASADSSGLMGVGLVLISLILGGVWFFPMMGMALGAYFTRPQAWVEKNAPTSIQAQPSDP